MKDLCKLALRTFQSIRQIRPTQPFSPKCRAYLLVCSWSQFVQL